MKRSATALGILLIASSPGLAEDPFQPTAAERGAIDKCLKRAAEEDVRSNDLRHEMMRPLAITLMLLLLMAAPVRAQDDAPTAAERKTIADCLDKNAGDDELKQMSACIGLVADPCPDAPGANTMTIVACQIREQKIWDDYLNDWYGEALKRLADEPNAAAALKEAQRAWIQFRDTKCDYWEKRYEGGTFASVAAGNCMRATTGQRALEMRAIFDDLDH